MKKFFLGIVVVVMVLAAIVFYQRQRISGALDDILKGKTYGSYGVKIEIPPTEGRVRGIFKPYVNLPRVVLNLSTWGLKLPLNFENAKVFQDLWGNGSLVLEVPRSLTPGEGIQVDFPAAELGLDGSIKLITAETITVQPSHKPDDKVQFLSPQLQFGNLSGVLPDLFTLSLQGILVSTSKQPGPSGMQLGAMNLGLESQVIGEEREWSLFSFGEGGEVFSHKGKAEVGGWKFQLQGTSKDLPFSELNTLIQEIKEGQAQIQKEFSGKNIKGPPNPQMVKSTLILVVQKIYDFIGKLQLVPVSKKAEWDGLKVVDEEGGERLLITPIQAAAQFKDSGSGFEAKAEGSLEKIRLEPLSDKAPVLLDKLAFNYRATFFDTSFSQLLGYFFRYYKTMLLDADRLSSADTLEAGIMSSLAQYPNQASMGLSVGQLTFSTDELKSKHQELKFGFQLEPRKMAYSFSDLFAYQFSEEKKQNIEGGKTEILLQLNGPWSSLINTARRSLRDEGDGSELLREFLEEQVGFIFNFLLDLGPNYFVFDLDSTLKVSLEGSLEGLSFPKDFKDGPAVDRWAAGLKNRVVAAFAKQGRLNVDLKVERLSKLQSSMDRWKSGSSLGLAVLAPYAQLDSERDTMEFHLLFQDGKVLINGQPNETLQKLIDPVLH